MRVERHADVAGFLAEAGSFLSAREAEHNLILGLCGRLGDDPTTYGPEPPYLATVAGENGVVAAALRTPPYNLVLSEVDDVRACDLLAGDAWAVYGPIRGVLGPVEPAARFVGAWKGLSGAGAHLARRQRAYRAERSEAPFGVAGSIRSYADADRGLVLGWLEAFFEEALGSEAVETAAGTLDHRLDDPHGRIVLWEDGGVPVSLAGCGGTTPNGIRVGPVYTPPELRRRGYATALTAELTRQLLQERRFCFLFTDLANPTSNSIYQQIGYEPVTDIDEWIFG